VKKKYTYEDVKNIVKNKGYKLIFGVSDGSNWKIIIQDLNGYLFNTQLCCLTSNKHPQIISERNEFVLENLQLWLNHNYLDYRLLSDVYNGADDYIILQDKQDYLYTATWSHLKQNHLPSIIHRNNLYTIHNIKLWCKNNSFELLSEQYEGSFIKLKWKCKKCGEIFYRSWQEISRGQECNYCNSLGYKFPEISDEWDSEKNKNTTVYDISYGCETKYWWRCRECGCSWLAAPNARTYTKSGCPACAESKLEKQISAYFYENQIPYESQVKFNNLVGLGGGLLSYDFRLKDYNFLIEAQGQQHEYPVDFKNEGMKIAQQNFEKQLIHDQRKKEYALSNGYNFLEIWYWDFDNIENILSETLSEKSEGVFNLSERRNKN
jgi:hypothetical protein